MSLFGCDHVLDVESAHYTPPPDKFKVARAVLSEESLIRLFSGFTTVYFRCSKCGDLSEKIVTGEYEPQEKRDG